MDVGHVLFESASAERLSAWRAFFAAEEEGWAAASARAGVGAENSGTAYALEHQEVYMRFVALVEGQLEELLAPHGATMRSLFEKLQAMRANDDPAAGAAEAFATVLSMCLEFETFAEVMCSVAKRDYLFAVLRMWRQSAAPKGA